MDQNESQAPSGIRSMSCQVPVDAKGCSSAMLPTELDNSNLAQSEFTISRLMD